MKKSLWQSFENQNSELTVLLHFSWALLWHITFFCKCLIFREICNINLPLFSIFIKNRKKSILNVQFLNTQLYWSYHRDGHIQTASLVWWYRQCTSNTTIKERMLKPTLFPKVYKGVARMFFCLLYGVINHC